MIYKYKLIKSLFTSDILFIIINYNIKRNNNEKIIDWIEWWNHNYKSRNNNKIYKSFCDYYFYTISEIKKLNLFSVFN